MKFCTKCGRELQEGEICSCQFSRFDSGVKGGSSERRATSQGRSETSHKTRYQGRTSAVQIPEAGNIITGLLGKMGLNISGDDDSTYERDRKIVPDSVYANDGETPIRQYNFAKLRTRLFFSKAEARLQITNKRVLIRAAGRSLVGRVSLQQEFGISELTGVEMRKTHVFSLLNYLGGISFTGMIGSIGFGISRLFNSDSSATFGEILTIIFSLAAIVGCVFLSIWLTKKKSLYKYYLIRQIPLSLAVGAFSSYAEMNRGLPDVLMISFASFMGLCCLINLFLLSFVPSLLAVFKTKGGSEGMVLRKTNIFSLIFGKDPIGCCGFKEVIPWVDTDRAIREVGTIIDDLHTMGDAAIQKWRR